ncbi:MAG: 4Fe-4S ferredoxin [Succiniclasticum sp.]|jgi:formate dehydrogenase (coenzyme F420) beta subunit
MQKIEELMRAKAAAVLADGTADCVLAWKQGEFPYDHAPALFRRGDDLSRLVYDVFCPANLAKYLIGTSRAGERAAVFLKPCDTYGVNQLLKDHRIVRDRVLAIGTPCSGMVDVRKLREAGCRTILAVEDGGDVLTVTTARGPVKVEKGKVLLRKCLACKGPAYRIADDEIGTPLETPHAPEDRYAEVRAIEALPPEERFAFWKQELSKCIRCNTCRDVCPACSCEQCIFDHPGSGADGKAYADTSQEAMFHIIRAFHVAGRCTGCGECGRVCPQGIRLDLLNSKFAKDIDEFFGPYQPGEDADTPAPQFTFRPGDPEPDTVTQLDDRRDRHA